MDKVWLYIFDALLLAMSISMSGSTLKRKVPPPTPAASMPPIFISLSTFIYTYIYLKIYFPWGNIHGTLHPQPYYDCIRYLGRRIRYFKRKVFGIWEGMWGFNQDRILTSQSFTLYDLWQNFNNNINIDKSQYVRYFGNSISWSDRSLKSTIFLSHLPIFHQSLLCGGTSVKPN